MGPSQLASAPEVAHWQQRGAGGSPTENLNGRRRLGGTWAARAVAAVGNGQLWPDPGYSEVL